MLIVVGFRPVDTFTRHQKPYLFQTMLGENRHEQFFFVLKKVMPIFGRSDTFSSMFQYVSAICNLSHVNTTTGRTYYIVFTGPRPLSVYKKKLNKYTFVTTTILFQ